MAGPDPNPEQPIEDLPRGAVQDSIRVFAEWMRENRKALQEQMTGLAIRFEEVDRENKRRLDEIHQETRKTNGRVTGLENDAKLATALTDGRNQWETEHEQLERESTEKKERAGEKLRDRLTSVGLVVLGLVGGGLLNHLGI